MKALLMAAIAAATVSTCSTAHACYSEGFRAGVVQKLSQKGIALKSYEGELVMDGVKFRQTGGGNVWKFSARDAAVGKKLEQAMMTGKSVTLKYCQELVSVTTDTKYIITDVGIH